MQDKLDNITKRINRLYDNAGLKINYGKDGEQTYIAFHLDEVTAKRVVKRGRKIKTSKTVTYADVVEMKNSGKTNNQIMDELGIPRASFYRRMKNIDLSDLSRPF
jgi:DNA invertase Pin-like site-specific DNA recombinase